jgi:hypothetical protein
VLAEQADRVVRSLSDLRALSGVRTKFTFLSICRSHGTDHWREVGFRSRKSSPTFFPVAFLCAMVSKVIDNLERNATHRHSQTAPA